jgi:hypothetical protein
MYINRLLIFASSFLIPGCENSNQVIIEPNPLPDPFQVSALNYSTNFYFVDTSYISSYEPYYLTDTPAINWSMQITQSEVWIARLGSVPDPRELRVKAHLHLPAYNGNYPDSLRNEINHPGNIEDGPFIRLDASQYELIEDGYLGIIRIDQPYVEFSAIAIAFERADGTQFGEFIRNVIHDSAFFDSHTQILLKLVRPRNLLSNGPAYKSAWSLLVKSIYPIGYTGVIKTLFHLDVFQETSGSLGPHSVLGQPLIVVLGLDRFSSDGSPAPKGDGVFDYRPGRTIDQNHGYILLPYLRPFDDGIRRYFVSIGQPISPNSTVLIPQIYDTIATAQSSTFTYTFKGSALHQ